jgi:hypothetical protein
MWGKEFRQSKRIVVIGLVMSLVGIVSFWAVKIGEDIYVYGARIIPLRVHRALPFQPSQELGDTVSEANVDNPCFLPSI